MKSDRAATALDRSALGWLARRLPLWRGVLVLTHHRIGSSSGSPYDRNLWSATAEELDRQLRFLAREFDVVGTADLPSVVRRGRGRHVVLTFDDGYRDNAEVAYPLLRAYGLPATFFLATGFLDRPRLPWWDELSWTVRSCTGRRALASGLLPRPVPLDEPGRERALDALVRHVKALAPPAVERFLDALCEETGTGRAGPEHAEGLWMTWPMARELAAGGMTIGAHTVGHPALATLSPGEQEAEIAGSLGRVEEELGVRPTAFSYPYGIRTSFDATTKGLLRRHGVALAFGFHGGHVRFDRFDPYDVERTTVSGAGAGFRSLLAAPQVFARW